MRKSFVVIVLAVLVVLYASLFVVQEGQRGIVLRFGKVLRDGETSRWCMRRVCTSRSRSSRP